jgi:hypothetical protein
MPTYAPKYLLFGDRGRLGGLCAEVLAECRIPYGTLQRSGDLMFAGACQGNIYRGSAAPGHFSIIDASIDHSSLDRMVAHEDAKLKFLEALEARGDLGGLVAFSSGVVEFENAQIKTDWHLGYKHLKLRLEAFAQSLSCPAYCPRLFVVIGPRSFRAATTGWVSIVRQACVGGRVEIAAPTEPRSWVAEIYLREVLARFFEAPQEYRPSTPLNGTFCLGDIARSVAGQLKRSIVIESCDAPSWLSVPYVSHVQPATSRGCVLDQILAPLAAAYAASVGSA